MTAFSLPGWRTDAVYPLTLLCQKEPAHCAVVCQSRAHIRTTPSPL